MNIPSQVYSGQWRFYMYKITYLKLPLISIKCGLSQDFFTFFVWPNCEEKRKAPRKYSSTDHRSHSSDQRHSVPVTEQHC